MQGAGNACINCAGFGPGLTTCPQLDSHTDQSGQLFKAVWRVLETPVGLGAHRPNLRPAPLCRSRAQRNLASRKLSERHLEAKRSQNPLGPSQEHVGTT